MGPDGTNDGMPGDSMEQPPDDDVMPADEMEPEEHAVLIEVVGAASAGETLLGGANGFSLPTDLLSAAVGLVKSALGARGIHVTSDPLTVRVDGGGGFAADDEQSVVFSARVTGKSREALEQDPGVRVHSNPRIAPYPGGVDCDTSAAKGDLAAVATYVGADKLWDLGYKGETIVIGVVDGGINNDAASLRRVKGGWPDDYGTVASWKQHGNMTSTDALGMAPSASLLDIRIATPPSDMISLALQGFDWALQSFRKNRWPQILTNSWGIYQQSWAPDYAQRMDHVFTRKVQEAIEAGMIVIFAAGNCGSSCPVDRCGTDIGPRKSIWGANGLPAVISVGAVNVYGNLAGYSSQGPMIWLLPDASGKMKVEMEVEKPDICGVTNFAGYFPIDTGTSAACPIVAGLAALLKDAYPDLKQAQLKEALIKTARSSTGGSWDPNFGYGVIDAKAAFDYIGEHFYADGPRTVERALATAK